MVLPHKSTKLPIEFVDSMRPNALDDAMHVYCLQSLCGSDNDLHTHTHTHTIIYDTSNVANAIPIAPILYR